MSNLERAVEIAVSAHKGQTDKGGNPYILHPLRVMMSLETDEEKIVGVLHDVVEDSDWTFEDLKSEGFSDEIIDALKSVTKNETEHGTDEGYYRFVERAKTNRIGKRVKIADLRDNMDITRIPVNDLDEKTLARLKKYKKSLDFLTGLAEPSPPATSKRQVYLSVQLVHRITLDIQYRHLNFEQVLSKIAELPSQERYQWKWAILADMVEEFSHEEQNLLGSFARHLWFVVEENVVDEDDPEAAVKMKAIDREWASLFSETLQSYIDSSEIVIPDSFPPVVYPVQFDESGNRLN